jgi:hypothetical protein
MYETLYIICSYATFFGTIIAWISFHKEFNKLKVMQKVSLVVITIGSVVPIIVGVIQGISN